MKLWPWGKKAAAHPAQAPGSAASGRALPEDKDVRGAVEGFRRFRQQFSADKAFYEKLAEHQAPNMLWIGCSDSRVVPDLITSADPGTLFVVRNIANLVPPAGSGDASVGAAIEYAVLHLGIDDIVVCGHTGCGGVKAIHTHAQVEPHLRRWIANGHVGAAQTTDEAVKANILAQRENLLTYDFVRERVEAGNLVLHGWLFDMSEGDLLAYDFEQGQWRTLGDADD